MVLCTVCHTVVEYIFRGTGLETYLINQIKMNNTILN
jgi:hypothetical protein